MLLLQVLGLLHQLLPLQLVRLHLLERVVIHLLELPLVLLLDLALDPVPLLRVLLCGIPPFRQRCGWWTSGLADWHSGRGVVLHHLGLLMTHPRWRRHGVPIVVISVIAEIVHWFLWRGDPPWLRRSLGLDNWTPLRHDRRSFIDLAIIFEVVKARVLGRAVNLRISLRWPHIARVLPQDGLRRRSLLHIVYG